MSGKSALLPCHLTPKQRQVMQLVAEGHNNKEIAHRLNTGLKGIEYHRDQLWKKTRCKSDFDLWNLAVYWGMIPCPCKRHTLKRILDGKE